VRLLAAVLTVVIRLVVGLEIVADDCWFVLATIAGLFTIVATLGVVRLLLSFLLLLTLLLSKPINLLRTETVILRVEQDPSRQLQSCLEDHRIDDKVGRLVPFPRIATVAPSVMLQRAMIDFVGDDALQFLAGDGVEEVNVVEQMAAIGRQSRVTGGAHRL
jgi:hypothetical protein